MTTDATRSSSRHAEQAMRLEAEVLAALWEEVPFPRLPNDAPPELRELLVNIENPRKVYTIHRASRRHHLHVLVEKFVAQLRYGCGFTDCQTSSCFSCRRRLSGKAPIRRYSPASARTLAVYLASQDNPELYICPRLAAMSEPSDAAKPLIFAPKFPPSHMESLRRPAKHPIHAKSVRSQATQPTKPAIRQPLAPLRQAQPLQEASSFDDLRTQRESEDTEQESHEQTMVPKSERDKVSSGVNITEKYVSKDYRSFAANMFGTVAFKMIEWLTPTTVESMSQRATDVLSQSKGRIGSRASATGVLENGKHSAERTPAETDGSNDETSLGRRMSIEHKPTSGASRRNSNTRILTHTHGKSQVRLDSIDGSIPFEAKITSPTRPTAPDLHQKALVRSPSAISRASTTISVDDDFDVQSDDGLPEVDEQDDKAPVFVDGANGEESSTSGELLDTPDESLNSCLGTDDQNPCPELQHFLPQTFSHLSPQTVQFMCDVLQADATGEKHLLEPSVIHGGNRSKLSQLKKLRRRRTSNVFLYPQNLRFEWKLFIEQAIFSALSDPRTLLKSFTTSEGIIDSQSLWYCMLRLTRVAPTLVFDSLWLALSVIFRPEIAEHCSSAASSRSQGVAFRSYSDEEAGALLSICFHALVAAAPLVTDYRQLADMSRIRSHGLTLAGGGAPAQQPTSLCLQYEDIFTDDLALRLARRLMSAIPVRLSVDTWSSDNVTDEACREERRNVVDLVLSHIDTSPQPLFEFSKHERSLHEKRVPILLLDWARAVMLQDWDGEAEVDGEGPFGGALSLIEAMYRKRQDLLLGDVHFRSEYFGERLDCIKMPVSWLTFASSQKKTHLLDYPYIFNPASLVSYFRAINFSRMSRSYEESTSLRSRIGAVIAPESLVTDPHHKNILQDLLKVPSTRYLILDIGRKDVLRDAFDQLWRRENRELMRPLKVHLGEDTGEEGFDSGGVQQEFFRLAIAEALDPDYGAFTVDDRTRMTWFQPSALQPDWKYELIGLLMSLAVYNGLTLPVTFPKALYQKLLGEPVTELHHIADGWPDLANGLTNLLEWNEKDGAIEDVFVLTYEFSASMFGQPISRVMRTDGSAKWPQFSSSFDAAPLASENPADAPMVTSDNRQAYVDDYIRYLTDVSVAPQFEAFARGFRTCLHPKSLTLLTPSLLQSIVEGAQDIDISELRRAARYVGWDASHRTVRDFWSIVKRFDDRMRRKLLEFVTASDRVPVGGVSNIQFIIQKNGEEESEGGHLPTAYTCYGTLLLPEYPSREALRERLAMALENAQGFGFA